MNIIVLSLLSTVVFGIIDAIFFLFFEETLQTKIQRITNVSTDVAELITGGLSASAAIFTSSRVRISLGEEIILLENPLLDVTGILTGTFVVIFAYILYRKYIQCYLFSSRCKK